MDPLRSLRATSALASSGMAARRSRIALASRLSIATARWWSESLEIRWREAGTLFRLHPTGAPGPALIVFQALDSNATCASCVRPVLFLAGGSHGGRRVEN